MSLAFTLHINFQVCVFIVFVCIFCSTFLYYDLNESCDLILGLTKDALSVLANLGKHFVVSGYASLVKRQAQDALCVQTNYLS